MNLDDKILQNYIEGTCTEQQLQVISQWLGESPDNAKSLFGLELTMQLPQKKQFEKEPVIRSAEKDLMSRIDGNEQSGEKAAIKHRNRKRILRWTGATVAAALVLAGVIIFKDDIIVPQTIAISVPAGGEIMELSLPDGSTVWLNRSGTLEYSPSFGKTSRNLYLDGEAYFEVVRDEKNPFIVKSPSLQATVLGTTFNMSSYAGSNVAEVTLINGAVEVKGNRNEGQIVLTPGQRAEVDVTAKRMTVKTVNAKLDAVWHNNLIPFNDASLYEIAATLEQFYNVKIDFADEINISSHYSGVLHRKESIDEVLKSLKNSIPIDYTIDGNTVHISQR